jgi:DNA polymerase III epsilon subunit-like protein
MAVAEIWTLDQGRAQLKFNEWNQRKDNVVVLDTETTGLYGAEIVEISVIGLDGNVLIDTLVKPKAPIPKEAKRIHGISDKMVADKPSWPEVWDKLFPIIKDKLILIYNSEFDVRLMKESFDPYPEHKSKQKQVDKLKTECVMRAYAELIGSPKWIKLTQASAHSMSHRSIEDCRATLKVIKKAYNPEFTEEILLEMEKWYELEKVSKRIRYLSYRMKEMMEEQAKLMKKQKELQFQLSRIKGKRDDEKWVDILDEESMDISDDDLPF